MKFEFYRKIFEKTQISNLMKLCQIGAKLLRADGQTDGRTDMTKLKVTFRNFANASKLA